MAMRQFKLILGSDFWSFRIGYEDFYIVNIVLKTFKQKLFDNIFLKIF